MKLDEWCGKLEVGDKVEVLNVDFEDPAPEYTIGKVGEITSVINPEENIHNHNYVVKIGDEQGYLYYNEGSLKKVYESD